jgi:hypothetical protein
MINSIVFVVAFLSLVRLLVAYLVTFTLFTKERTRGILIAAGEIESVEKVTNVLILYQSNHHYDYTMIHPNDHHRRCRRRSLVSVWFQYWGHIGVLITEREKRKKSCRCRLHYTSFIVIATTDGEAARTTV